VAWLLLFVFEGVTFWLEEVLHSEGTLFIEDLGGE